MKQAISKQRTAKTKIIFIGDFKESATVQLLVEFVQKYGNNYDISVTGYNFSYINKINQICDEISLYGMSSSKHIYDKYIAEYVVITTQAPRFIRVKNSQHIIYILSEFNTTTFAGCLGDVDQIVTDNKELYTRMSKAFPEMSLGEFSGNTEHEKAQSILDELIIRDDPPKHIKRYLLVTNRNNNDIARDSYGVGRYLKRVSESSSNDVIALSVNGGIGCLSGTITFSNSFITGSILNEFDGTVIFDSNHMKSLFEAYVQDNDIALKAKQLCMLPDLKLMSLVEAAEESESFLENEELSTYSKYRRLIKKLYATGSYNQIKVSIIICRYNTPVNLLVRAINSALHCGHENVEVIVVDDGSNDEIEEELAVKINDERVFYYFKHNEGLGFSRNFGVKKATGEYVYYLDSDDTIHPNGMACLVTHAAHYKLDMVIGKRVLCDEQGKPFCESFGSLAGDSFACYYSSSDYSGVYSDAMINNLLIKRDVLIDKNIWFVQGLYEDLDYSAKLYSSLKEYHYINVVIHDWYQYRSHATLSSTVSSENMRERVAKEESAWTYIPERIRPSRIKTILQVNFNLYLNNYYHLSEQERTEVWKLLRTFIQGKEDYLDLNTLPEKTKELSKALINGNVRFFEYVIDRYYDSCGADDDSRNNFVVLTPYHLYVACLHAIHSTKKPRLYLCQSYVAFDTNLIFNIKKTGLFEHVKPFTYGNMVGNLFKELKERPGEEDIVIPNHLYNKFAEVFKECNTQKDCFYIFSDTHPYWYFIERECSNIVKLEDAYDSFDREIKTFELQGIWAGIQKYEGVYYPKMYFKSEKIRRIIVSKRHDDLPKEYARRIEVLDTRQLEHDDYESIKRAMLQIYSVDTSLFTADTTLLLTQPLALFGYCSPGEQKALMKKMVSFFPESNLVIKPHPADNMDYRFLNGLILPKSIPIEIYNLMDVNIERAITFGSSAIETIGFAREKKAFFKLHDFEFDDVVMAIKDMVGDIESSKRTSSRGKRVQKAMKRLGGNLRHSIKSIDLG